MSTLVAQTISNGTVSTSSENVIRGSARAWVNYNQVTSTINGSYNVSSVTNNGTGDFTINYTNALPNANYSWAGSSGFGVGGQTNWLSLPGNIAVASCITTTSLRVVNSYANSTNNSNLPYNGVIVFSS
jgi:hypothetical protein